MATSSEIGLAASINILTAFAFLVAFAILRIQPFNDRVYFPKWYLKGLRNNPLQSGAFVQKFMNLDFRSYLRFLNWMPAALRMPEPELIDHAGLDSVVYLRIYLTGFVVIFYVFVLLQYFIFCCLQYETISPDALLGSPTLLRGFVCALVTTLGCLEQTNYGQNNLYNRFWKHASKNSLRLTYAIFIFDTLSLYTNPYGLFKGLKIFVPIACLAFTVMVPVNWTNRTLEESKLTYSDIDKLSISNIPNGSNRFFTHLVMAYAFTFWTCYILKREYEIVAKMRLHFIASEQRRPDQFTVLVRNVPPDPDETVNELVEHFFLVNHPDQYLSHQVVYNANLLSKLVNEKKTKRNWLDYYQLKYDRSNQSKRPLIKTGYLGLFGKSVDAIDFYQSEIEKLLKEISKEREKIIASSKYVMPAAFVSFKSRWGAAVCAQTEQSRNPTIWLTEWAPEPRDVYWDNLAIPFVSLTVRRLIIAVAFFFLTFFFMIPIAFVQSLANIDGIVKAAPFMRGIMEVEFVKSFIQGVLPGIALKIFLVILPSILMMMSKFEGFTSISALERRSASRYYIFQFINVFLGSIITGTAFQQLNTFIHQPANTIPVTIGASIPMKATFFITYIMVDGWAGVAGEILRLKPLIFYHLKNFFLVKTEKDREEAMNPGSLSFNTGEPQIQLYFLLGLVYAVVTPILLPFIVVFFGLAYVVYRHQIINVYNQQYESAGSFWPDVHGRIITALIVSQLLLMGLLSTKEAAQSTPLLIALPVLTIWFHRFCKGRYEPAFIRFPLQEAMMKDTLERAREPCLNVKGYLENAYVHPVFYNEDRWDGSDDGISDEESQKEPPLVATKRPSRTNTPARSQRSESTRTLLGVTDERSCP